jgi:hypothetical protein
MSDEKKISPLPWRLELSEKHEEIATILNTKEIFTVVKTTLL